ncbi:DUF3347 domain-containing protein [Chitinophaga sp. SYP-B3965]|uniref:DUF3347 domain-containing protein n=1 Tax=Chitinophaga sp. SYP-B3965 TaxID=2663120 RepID=UPI00129A0651|nr:DUF3347 domain-containing protein [Chitinophaga sp. SYP-B3965]MRG44401.1 DUF3347 domain-containing protein [Chitinophaga sp. SYP-B3965]
MRLNQYIWILATAALFAACQQAGTSSSADSTAQSTSGDLQAPFSNEFYDSLKVAMTAYYQLSGALVKSDTLAADLAAVSLKAHLDSLPITRLGVDSARESELLVNAGDIAAELKGLLIEKGGLDARRESFNMVSEMMYDLVKVTGLKGATVYRQYCPMAFNDKGAYWLSDKAEILNPYFGDAMLTCGSVTDTLRYQ